MILFKLYSKQRKGIWRLMIEDLLLNVDVVIDLNSHKRFIK